MSPHATAGVEADVELDRGRPPVRRTAATLDRLILTKPSKECTGNFFDDDVLGSVGVTDFSKYAADPTADLLPDFFV